MESTEKALEQIRAEWIAQGSPTPATVAKRAEMTSITVRRYLDGSTKRGDPAKVRALAIALGRMDIAESVRDSASAELSEQIMNYMSERFLLWRESNLEELATERKAREESEKRYAAEIERIITSKDRSIDLLNRRIAQLEEDKTVALRDKERIYGEMAEVRRTKRKRDALLIFSLIVIGLLLVAIIAYLFRFDVPNPGYGVFK